MCRSCGRLGTHDSRHWAGSGGGLGRRWSRVTPLLRGRRGTWRHLPSAGMALGDSHVPFVWQALHLVTSALLFCVAGVALTALGMQRIVAQAMPAAAAAAAPVWHELCPARHLPKNVFRMVACVTLGDIYLRFVWQAWHFVTSTCVLCGRRSAHGTGLALVAALVAAGRLGRRASFAWQALHLVTSAFVLCGRCGTYGTGLALVAALVAAGRLGRHASFAWQALHSVTSAFVLRGRRGAL
eukprot:s576_g10.t1